MPNSRLNPFTCAAKRQSWCVVGPRTMDRGFTRPLRMKPMSVSQVIPGAAGLRVCSTYHGPMRVLVAFRVAAEFSIVQRGQVPCSLSFTEPQNGQTYFPRSDSRMPSAPAGCKAEDVDSVV